MASGVHKQCISAIVITVAADSLGTVHKVVWGVCGNFHEICCDKISCPPSNLRDKICDPPSKVRDKFDTSFVLKFYCILYSVTCILTNPNILKICMTQILVTKLVAPSNSLWQNFVTPPWKFPHTPWPYFLYGPLDRCKISSKAG